MSAKFHISLDVKDLQASTRFYSSLFNLSPAKLKPGYAKFEVEDPGIVLSLMEKANAPKPNSPNHLGLRLLEMDSVLTTKSRLNSAGIETVDEMQTTCCYAVQNKVWARDPDGHNWEIYVLLADADVLAKKDAAACSTAGESCCAPTLEEISAQKAANASKTMTETCCAPHA